MIIESFENPHVKSVAGNISIIAIIQEMISRARTLHTQKPRRPEAVEIIRQARLLANMYQITDKQIVVKWPSWS